jgi:uncharacterized protein YndB with AHSA1/START domain
MAQLVEVETSRTIAAYPERIWSVVSDLRRLVDWCDFGEVEDVSGPDAAPGASYTLRTGLLGTASVRVVEAEPPLRLVLEAESPFVRELTSTLTLARAAGGNTEGVDTLRFRAGLGPLGALTRAALTRELRARSVGSLERLEGLFGRQPAP